MSLFYRADEDARLYRRDWDGEYVLYDDASGDTHLLNEFGLALLEHVTGSGASIEDLVDRVATEQNHAVDGPFAYEVKRAMDALVTAGLVRRVDS